MNLLKRSAFFCFLRCMFRFNLISYFRVIKATDAAFVENTMYI